MRIVFAVLTFWVLLVSGCINQFPATPCGIENCHGLDITCGSDIPDVCTEEYGLGDFCRDFASCEIIDGECRLVESKDFKRCKRCVEGCMELSGKEAFECEDLCKKALLSD